MSAAKLQSKQHVHHSAVQSERTDWLVPLTITGAGIGLGLGYIYTLDSKVAAQPWKLLGIPLIGLAMGAIVGATAGAIIDAPDKY